MTAQPTDTAQVTRQRLLEAALILFAEKGFDGTGIREIAAQAKANSAMVQYHFGGKTGLYAAALRCILGPVPITTDLVFTRVGRVVRM